MSCSTSTCNKTTKKGNCSKQEKQETLQDDYVNQQVNEMRCRLSGISHAFPQMEHFPAPWKLVYALVYDFLATLGLQNTLTVYGIEAEMKKSMDIYETGWFVNSFILQPNFHSMLKSLLDEFNNSGERISSICQGEKGDLQRFSEAQSIIEEQRKEERSLRADQSRRESESRRQDEIYNPDEEEEEEECLLDDEDELQFEEARKDLEMACSNSRMKIIQDIRQRHREEDAESDAQREECRRSINRKREADRVAQKEYLAMEAILANTRRRIVEDFSRQQETMAREWQPQEVEEAEQFVQKPTSEEIAAICQRAGLEMRPKVTRQRSLEAGSCGRCPDPRQNKSFRVVHRNKQRDWKIDSLGEKGPNGRVEPKIVITGEVENVCEMDLDKDEEEEEEGQDLQLQEEASDNHQSRLQVPMSKPTRPSRISSIHCAKRESKPSSASHRHSHSHHHKHHHHDNEANQQSRRLRPSSSSSQRQSLPAEICPCRVSAQERKKERESEDYVHFSRRRTSRRRHSARGGGQEGDEQQALNCIREI